MKYFGIFNEVAVTNLNLKGKRTILIRIFEPSSSSLEHNKILNETSYQDILELYLLDYVKEIKEGTLDATFKKLNAFILEKDFDEIIIHCTLGISRSPAIMICIAKILNNIHLENWLKEQFKHYNKYIVRVFEEFPYHIKEIDDNNFYYAYSNLKNNDQNKNVTIINEDESLNIDLNILRKIPKKQS